MPSFVFKLKKHEEYGSYGWAPCWMPNGDPLPGMAVAHDCLEHFPDADGSIEDELMALGASFYVRGLAGYYHLKGQHTTNPADNAASDFSQQWDYYSQGNRPKLRSPEYSKGGRKISAAVLTASGDDEVEEWCQRTATRGRAEICSEREATQQDLEEAGFSYPNISGWLRIGYRRAKARYRKASPFVICALFMDIEKKADEKLKHYDEMEGVELHVAFSACQETARVFTKEPWEDEEND